MKINKDILLEGKYDSFTRMVTNDVMKSINETQGDEGSNYIILPDDNEDIKYESSFGFNFSVHLFLNRVENIEIKGKKQDFFVNTYIDDEDQITMDITISLEFEPYCYERLFYKINEDIRHEIEHYLQKIHPDREKPNRPDTASYETTHEHHMDPSEIEALANGFYRRAKLEKIPFTDVVKQDLDREIELGNLNDMEANDIFNKIVLYARRRFPKAIYNI